MVLWFCVVLTGAGLFCSPAGKAAIGYRCLTVQAVSIAMQETTSGGAFDWHTAPARQFVITLSGTLEFYTRSQKHFILNPSTLLLAEDTAGGGHSWKLIDQEPWRRIYVVLAPGAEVSFTSEDLK
jgi:quercetin dioxygenase-like cupin family protein